MSVSKVHSDTHLTRQPAYNIYPGLSFSLPVIDIFLPLQSAMTEVNPNSLVVCVWTFETNCHGQQSRDNPSRLCKYWSASLKLNVNALIWNANCVLCDMSQHWRAALWDGKLKASLLPTGPLIIAIADRYRLGAFVGNTLHSLTKDVNKAIMFVPWDLKMFKLRFCTKGLKDSRTVLENNRSNWSSPCSSRLWCTVPVLDLFVHTVVQQNYTSWVNEQIP